MQNLPKHAVSSSCWGTLVQPSSCIKRCRKLMEIAKVSKHVTMLMNVCKEEGMQSEL